MNQNQDFWTLPHTEPDRLKLKPGKLYVVCRASHWPSEVYPTQAMFRHSKQLSDGDLVLLLRRPKGNRNIVFVLTKHGPGWMFYSELRDP